MPQPWDDWPQKDGEIIDLKGRRVIVRLIDGQETEAVFPRSFGCVFGSVIGWKVRIAFRPTPTKPAFVISRSLDDAHEQERCD
jgi:hypothetical protein